MRRSRLRGERLGSHMAEKSRGLLLTSSAVLFVLLAVSNFSKPFRLSPNVGFVFFGGKTHGIANAILGPVFGVLLVLYAIGIWRMRRWVLPIAYGYAAYVIVNLLLYTIRNFGSPDQPAATFMLGYIAIAIGVSSGTAILLHRRRSVLV
jgi:hypothetical protein